MGDEYSGWDTGGDNYDWNTINTGDSNSNFTNIGSFNGDNSFGNYDTQYPSQDYNWNTINTGPSNSNFSDIGAFAPQGQDFQSFNQSPQVPQQNPMASGSTDFLSRLFSNPQGLLRGLGALFEGYQNKQQAGNIKNLVQQQQQRLDPFASQRAQYQQALSNTVTDPYNQPIVKAQVDALAKAQAIKDAAAGRRSNSATSSPALLAAQAQIAQNYMNSLMTPAGANIAPSSAGLQQLLDASKYNTNGYLSPLMSMLGYQSQADQNQQTQTQLIQNMLAKLGK